MDDRSWSHEEGRPEGQGFMTFEEMAGTLGRSRWILVLTTLLGLGASYWWVANETQLYQSTALIRLMDTRGALTSGIAGSSEAASVAFGADRALSEIMVLRGRAVLDQVVDQLGLRLVDASGAPPSWASDVVVDLPVDEGRTYRVRFGAATFSVFTVSEDGTADGAASARYGTPAQIEGLRLTVAERPSAPASTVRVVPRYVAVDRLDAMLAASPRRSTDGIDVSVVSSSPRLATDAVDAVVHTFQRMEAATGRQQATRRRAFLEAQLAEQDSLLALAEADLAAFRSSRQVYSSQERLQAEQASMLELESRRRELESHRRIYRSLLAGMADPGRWASDYGALISSSAVADDPLVTQYYARLVQYQVQRDSLTTGPHAATSRHPRVQRLDSLLTQTEDRLLEVLSNQVKALDAQIDELAALRTESASDMAGPLSAEAEEGRLARKVDAIRTLSDELRSEVQRARVDEAVETGEVEIVELAGRALPINRRPVHKLFLGGIIGLLLGVATAFFREAANRTLARREDVQRLLEVDTVAVIPQIRSDRRSRKALTNGRNGRAIPGVRAAPMTVVRTGPGARELVVSPDGVEAYRTLRANLLLAPQSQSTRTLVVTSAAPEEGKTTTVANLGLAFARQGARVLMLDGDLRRPDLARLVGLPKAPGLTEILLGETSLRAAVRRTRIDGLEVITSGYLSENSAELLCGRAMEALLVWLWRAYDVVLIDTPPLLATADAAVLGARADGVLLVVRAGFVDKQATRQVRDQLRHVGARLVGAVLNDPDCKVPGYRGECMYQYDYAMNREYRQPASGSWEVHA